MNERLAIVTLDPRTTAGVSTVTKYLYDMTEHEGYDPYIIFNAVPWKDCLTASDIFKGRWSLTSREVSVSGMEGKMIGRVFPELEIGDYVLNYPKWNAALEDANLAIGVGGAPLTCLPLVLTGQDYGCWIGTLIDDERATQRSMSVPWYVRDTLTRPILRRYERYILENSKYILSQSVYTKNKITGRYRINDSKIHHVPFPIDTTRYSPSRLSDQNTAVFVGRFTDPRKNIEMLLRAISHAKTDSFDPNLVLIGDTLTPKLENLINNLGIEKSVCCKGYVSDLPTELAKASVFALPSNQEGLGIAGLEAMSSGLPVVSTFCGGPEEYIIDGKNGFLVPKDNPDAMAQKLKLLLENPEIRLSMGRAARKHIIENYSKETIKPRLLDHIDKLSMSNRR